MNDRRSGYSRSYLFTVRVWSEDMGGGDKELRGEVRYVLSGGVHYFVEWTTLVAYLAEKMHQLEQKSQGGDEIINQADN